MRTQPVKTIIRAPRRLRDGCCLVPGEGFEPSVEDPKSSALPLGHPGAPTTVRPAIASSRGPAVTLNGCRSLRLVMRNGLAVAGVMLLTAACGAYHFPGESRSPSP